jgi:hypothetical protein
MDCLSEQGRDSCRMRNGVDGHTRYCIEDGAATRQFAKLEGVLDLGSPTSCHKRRKRILRIPRSTLERYIAERKVMGRRRKGQ